MSGDVVYPGLIIFDFLFFYKKKAPIQQEFSKQADIVLNRASVITGGQRGCTTSLPSGHTLDPCLFI